MVNGLGFKWRDARSAVHEYCASQTRMRTKMMMGVKICIGVMGG